MKKYAERFYKSDPWRLCREAYIKHVNGICERCGEAGKIVHHKIHLTPQNISDPRISLCFDNLELLCQDCHNKEHTPDMKHGRRKAKPNKQPARYRIDSNGNILPPGSEE